MNHTRWPKYTMNHTMLQHTNKWCSGEFGLRDPIVQKPFYQPESAASIVARVLYYNQVRSLIKCQARMPTVTRVVQSARVLSREKENQEKKETFCE